MNILYLNNKMTIGGVAKCILKLSKELVRENNIYIASNKYGGALLPEFEKIGIKNFSLYDIENKSPLIILKNVIKIIKIVKKNNIDIIHSHHRMTTLLARIASNFVKVKIIHTQHAIITDKRILTNLILNNIPVIAVSNGVKNNLIEVFRLQSSNIKVIYNSVNNTKYNLSLEDNILNYKRQGCFLIGCVSRLTKNKGIEVLIESASIINNKNIKFFIIGDGEKRKELEEYCKKLKVDNVEFLGFKANVMDYINNFDLIVQPSFSEGLGLTAIEAISQSKPVVASNIPGLNEVVIDGYNGLLFDAGDHNRMTSCIYDLYLDHERYREMSKNSLEYYKSKFDTNYYFLGYKKVYETI